MFKTNKLEMKKAKKLVSEALTLTCYSMYELNVRRRYILRPYVHKRFQQLCSASTPIEEKTLFPNDVTKRMKEITDASKINRQISSQNFSGQNSYKSSKNYRGRPAFRGRANNYTFQRGGRSRVRGFRAYARGKQMQF